MFINVDKTERYFILKNLLEVFLFTLKYVKVLFWQSMYLKEVQAYKYMYALSVL